MKDIPSSNFQASKNSQSKNFFGRSQYKTAISIARPAPLPPKLPTAQPLNPPTAQPLNSSTAQLLSKLKQPFVKKPAQDPAVSQEELNRLEAEQLLKLVTQSSKASKQKKISKKVLRQQGLLKLNLAKPVIPGHVIRPFPVPTTLSQFDLKYLLSPQPLNGSTPLHELSSMIDFAKIEADFNLPRSAPLPPPALRAPAIKLYPTRSEARRASRLARLEALKAKQTLQRLGLSAPAAQPPKVRLSSLPQILSNNPHLLPSKTELSIRQNLSVRQSLHQQHNESKKLTPEGKKAKRLRQLKRDSARGVYRSLYLLHASKGPSLALRLAHLLKKNLLLGRIVRPTKGTPLPFALVLEGGARAARIAEKKISKRLFAPSAPGKDPLRLLWRERIREATLAGIAAVKAETEERWLAAFEKENAAELGKFVLSNYDS